MSRTQNTPLCIVSPLPPAPRSGDYRVVALAGECTGACPNTRAGRNGIKPRRVWRAYPHGEGLTKPVRTLQGESATLASGVRGRTRRHGAASRHDRSKARGASVGCSLRCGVGASSPPRARLRDWRRALVVDLVVAASPISHGLESRETPSTLLAEGHVPGSASTHAKQRARFADIQRSESRTLLISLRRVAELTWAAEPGVALVACSTAWSRRWRAPLMVNPSSYRS
jgi:hypothetical protein